MNPVPQRITARDLPEIRAELATWLADTSPLGGPETWAAHLPADEAARERRAAGVTSTSLRAAQLFYASADMAHLAVAAGSALPGYRLHPEDMPAPHGLIVWETPVTEAENGGEYTGAPIIAASWGAVGNSVDVRTWATREAWLRLMAEGDSRSGLRALDAAEVRGLRLRHPQPLVCQAATRMPFGRMPGWLAAIPTPSGEYGLSEVQDRIRAGSRIEAAERALIVSWLLMGQTLIREERVQASKAAAKRIGRLDPALLTAVRYVQLRHRTVLPGQRLHGDGPARAYQNRWIVSGHWRNQFYPSRNDHRPIWIDSHVKGPDGAPILDPDKLVNVLRR